MAATLATPLDHSHPRLLRGDLSKRHTLAEYVADGGYDRNAWSMSPSDLRTLVGASGLSGRGGAGFPAAVKWERVAAQPGQKVLVVNAAETEPGSAKDRLLLLTRPHAVLEGARLTALAIGATECVLYLPERRQQTCAAVLAALGELCPTSHLRWRVVGAPAAYVAGEESAAVQRANGRRAVPTYKPPRPFERGVAGRPTLVHNVETLANVPLIARYGSDWFRSVGTHTTPGAVLVTLSGSIARSGVCEVPAGTPLVEIIEGLGGGTGDGFPVQAVLPGGYFSGWLSADALHAGVRYVRDDLGRFGASPGSGAISVVSDGVCGLYQAAALLRFFADQSARQCGMCINGTAAMADALGRILRGAARPDDLSQLERWATRTLPGRGACGHLDGAALAARSALQVFSSEIQEHLRFGSCGRPERLVLPGIDPKGMSIYDRDERRPFARAHQPAALRPLRVLQ